MDLTAECAARDGVMVVSVNGDVDMYTCNRVTVKGEPGPGSSTTLRELLVTLAEGGPVVLDLDGVSFIDGHGLAVLSGAAKAAQAAGHPMVACGVQERVRKLFRLSGLDKMLPVRQLLAEAVNEVRKGHHVKG